MNISLPIISIYNDAGVSKESYTHTLLMLESMVGTLYKIESINATEIIRNGFKPETKLFILPGGADLPYVEKLSGKGNQVIREYVEHGGSFLGICAGSYYASSKVTFDRGGPYEVIGPHELALFEGEAIGPTIAKYSHTSSVGARACTLKSTFVDSLKTCVYYFGGGTFLKAEKSKKTTILARYYNENPAIIQVNIKKGIVVLSAPHFEYDPHLLNTKDVYLQPIISELIVHTKSRNELTKRILHILGVKTNESPTKSHEDPSHKSEKPNLTSSGAE